MIDYSVFSQLAAARGSIISGPIQPVGNCFQFLHLGQIRVTRHLVIVRVGGPFLGGNAAGGRRAAGGGFWWVGFSPLQFSVPKGTGETGDWRNTSDLGATAFSSCLQFVASH